MQFADIKNDIAFRKLFTNETKTEILISFLNAVLKLEGRKQITWVDVSNPYQVPIVIGGKSTILDVKAKDREGNEYIVEMQVTDKVSFPQRVLYYSAKSYASQLDIGEDFCKLRTTIFIGILNFEFLETKNYISRHLILDTETHEHKLKDLEFNFIELPKFDKTEQTLTTLLDKWVYFIKNAENLTVIPDSVDDEGLKSAYREADRHTWSKRDLEAYSYARMRETDDKAEKMLVIEKAKVQIANSLFQTNMNNEEIAKHTGLSVEKVEQLRLESKE